MDVDGEIRVLEEGEVYEDSRVPPDANSAVQEPKPQPPRRKRDRRRTLTKIDQRSRS